MDTSCWQRTENGLLNCYGLVTYIDGELGEFLLGLRREIVPECQLRSHLSFLTPRALGVSNEAALREIRTQLDGTERFEVALGDVTSFPSTEVVYIELGEGKARVMELHDQLNQNGLGCQEKFAYHPHITLAQELPGGHFADALQHCQRRWAEYRGPRSFPVETLTLTQYSISTGKWVDLGESTLSPAVSLR